MNGVREKGTTSSWSSILRSWRMSCRSPISQLVLTFDSLTALLGSFLLVSLKSRRLITLSGSFATLSNAVFLDSSIVLFRISSLRVNQSEFVLFISGRTLYAASMVASFRSLSVSVVSSSLRCVL